MKATELSKHLKRSRAKRINAIAPIREGPPHFSPSSMNNFLTCRRLCYWYLVRRLVKKGEKEALEIGLNWGNVMDELYSWEAIEPAVKALKKHYKKMKKKRFMADNTIEDLKVQEAMLTGMMKGYYEVHKEKDFKKWKFIRNELPFDIEDFMNTGLNFTGRLDGVIKINTKSDKGIWILEHKTTKDLRYHSIEGVRMSNQALGYMAAATHLLGEKPRGIIWNVVRKPSIRQKKNQSLKEYCEELVDDYQARPDFYFLRHYVNIKQSHIDQWAEEMTQAALDLHFCLENPTLLQLWYKNTNACANYGGCDYFPLCARGEKRSTLTFYETKEYRR